MDAEQFSLKWNNFHSNLTSGFHALLQANDLIDVTFAVEGKFLQAHKLVLSVCSPYFKQMFKIHPDKHPIIILKGVSYNDLSDILLFMYQGEVNVRQENLANFLKAAELLQVKGLTEDDSSDSSKQDNHSKKEPTSDSRSQYHYQDSHHQDLTSNRPKTPVAASNPINKRSVTSPQINMDIKKQRLVTEDNSSTDAQDNMTVTPKSEPAYMDDDYESSSGMGDFAQLMESSQKDLSLSTPPSLMPPLASSILQDSTQLDHGAVAPRWKNSGGKIEPADWSSSSPSNNYGVKMEEGPNNGSSTSVAKTGSPRGAGSFACGQCFKSFTRRDHLRTHETNIHGEKMGPLICDICQRYYKNTESMRKHMAKYHSGGKSAKDFPAPICIIEDVLTM